LSPTGLIPPLSEEFIRSLVPPQDLNPVKGGHYREIGEDCAGYCRTFCGLAPDHRILDLGCGAGALAVALLGYLSPSGSYAGLDVLPDVVAWCRENITRHFPNFRFQVADVANRNFNRAGSLSPSEYRLPYPDASFDVVHLRSVFTHMGPREVDHYLREIARVIVPGGRCMSTYFLLNQESLDMMRRLPVRQFPYEQREYLVTPVDAGAGQDDEGWVPYRVSEPGDVGAVAHFEGFARRSIVSSGLQVMEPIRYGRWCGRSNPWSNQDIIVMERKMEVKPSLGCGNSDDAPAPWDNPEESP
jgi:SAM-dependent methyltransferase